MARGTAREILRDLLAASRGRSRRWTAASRSWSFAARSGRRSRIALRSEKMGGPLVPHPAMEMAPPAFYAWPAIRASPRPSPSLQLVASGSRQRPFGYPPSNTCCSASGLPTRPRAEYRSRRPARHGFYSIEYLLSLLRGSRPSNNASDAPRLRWSRIPSLASRATCAEPSSP